LKNTVEMKSIQNGKLLLFILPLFYLLTACLFIYSIRYFYIANFDSTYVYLMNGTNIASGHLMVGNNEHPGAPVEIITAIVIFIKHCFTGNGNILYQDVLLHPESYLLTCSAVLIMLFTIGSYFAGAYIFRHTGNMLLALLFQLSPLFYREMVQKTVLLSAESIMVIVNMWFIPYIYIKAIYQNQPGREPANKSIMLFGLYTALLFTTKVYCALFCLPILFLLNSNRQRIIYLFYCGLFSLLLLFPIYSRFRNWIGTVKSMILHQGAYGQGSSGFINGILYRNNLLNIFTTHYIFCLIYLIVAVAFVMSIRKVLKEKIGISGFISPVTGIFIFFTLFVVVIAKQYTVIYPEPLTHEVVTISKYYYFTPLIGWFPVFICIAYSYFSTNLFSSIRRKAGYALLIVFTVFASVRTYGSCYMACNQGVTPESTSAFLEKYKDTPLIIVSDGNKSCVQPAIFLGIAYSGPWGAKVYTEFIKKVYPDTYLYTTYNKELIFWGEDRDINSILKKNKQALVYISGKDSVVKSIIVSAICNGTMLKNNYSKIYANANNYENVYLLKADTAR